MRSSKGYHKVYRTLAELLAIVSIALERERHARCVVANGRAQSPRRAGSFIRNDAARRRVASIHQANTGLIMTKPVQPVPEDNKSHKGPGSAPAVETDTTKGHRNDEKHNIDEQGDHANLKQNTSNRRSG